MLDFVVASLRVDSLGEEPNDRREGSAFAHGVEHRPRLAQLCFRACRITCEQLERPGHERLIRDAAAMAEPLEDLAPARDELEGALEVPFHSPKPAKVEEEVRLDCRAARIVGQHLLAARNRHGCRRRPPVEGIRQMGERNRPLPLLAAPLGMGQRVLKRFRDQPPPARGEVDLRDRAPSFCQSDVVVHTLECLDCVLGCFQEGGGLEVGISSSA